MRNSKDYSKKIQKLYRSLSRKYPKVEKVNHEEVEHAVVYAIISENMSEKATEFAFQKLPDLFVDLNDLRVSRADEIIEMLGEDTPVTRDLASTINRILNGIFNEYHKVSLEPLKKMGKRPAKQVLEKIDGTSRFVVDYCMLTSLKGHAIPLTKTMIEFLKNNELVDPEADQEQIEGFLAKQIPAKNGYDFYVLLRRESEAQKEAKKKKTKTKDKKKTKTKEKTKKRITRKK
jgi:endonuclease III